jgi:glycosyltransferase involved in cell wall biosynthesis
MKLNICYYSEGETGTSYYRAIQPMKFLKALGHRVFRLPVIPNIDPKDKKTLEKVEQVISCSDIFFTHSPRMHMKNWIKAYRQLNTIESKGFENKIKQYFVLDYDDDIFNLSPLNPAYIDIGVREWTFTFESGVKYCNWIDKQPYETEGLIKTFDIKRNMERQIDVAECLMYSDAVTTTTSRLAKNLCSKISDKNNSLEVIKKFIPLPNAIDLDLFDFRKKVPRSDKLFKILWTVSDSHMHDFGEFRPYIGAFLRKYPQARLVVFGKRFATLQDIPLSQCEWVPWENGMENYARKLYEINPDLAIAPLRDTEFNWNKSPLKWEEYTALQIPSVVSWPVYSDVVEDGVNGLIAKDWEDFVLKMESVINNKVNFRDMVANGYNLIKDSFSGEAVARQYEKAFYALTGKGLILNNGGNQ